MRAVAGRGITAYVLFCLLFLRGFCVLTFKRSRPVPFEYKAPSVCRFGKYAKGSTRCVQWVKRFPVLLYRNDHRGHSAHLPKLNLCERYVGLPVTYQVECLQQVPAA